MQLQILDIDLLREYIKLNYQIKENILLTDNNILIRCVLWLKP